ncbi:MAG: pilus assembly protein [Azospirillaceae bacterium]|nr:pilus assembly protein [Azospirillaceae bacterium]
MIMLFSPRFRRLIRDRNGNVSIEVAFVFPILVLMLGGVYQLWQALNTSRQVQIVADSIGQMLSQNLTNTLASNDLLFAARATPVLFPRVLADTASKTGTDPWMQGIKLTISSVVFSQSVTPTKANPSPPYDIAQVVWSFGSVPRPCATAPVTTVGGAVIKKVSDTATPSSTTLPTDVYQAGSAIVTDVEYEFKPSLWGNVLPLDITFKRSSYFQPRYLVSTDWMRYSPDTSDAYTKVCTQGGF